MAVQGLFCRTSNLISNYCGFLAIKLPQINQSISIRQKVVDKLKELKIPEKPKRPLTPYFQFLQDHRSKIIKEHPDWRVPQISAQCAYDWKSVDSSTKTKYENKFKHEMEQYAAKYLKYANSLTEEQKTALKEYNNELKRLKMKRERRKMERENEKPKRPVGAYTLFVMEQAKEYPNKPYIQLVRDLKNTWAAMPVGEKSKYFSAVKKAKEQYEKDLNQWEIQMINDGKVDIVRQRKLKNPKKSKLNKSSHCLTDGHGE